MFKKGFREAVENYHSVSILPVMSKIFENLFAHQITSYMEKFLSKGQCAFWKG